MRESEKQKGSDSDDKSRETAPERRPPDKLDETQIREGLDQGFVYYED
jgi:hypothetical protein